MDVTSLAALNRWLLVQAVFWTALLPALVWRVGLVGFEPWMAATVGGALALSYPWLWHVLRVQGRPADFVTAARFLALLLLCIPLARLAAPAAGGTPVLGSWTWLALLGVALADLVDGALARRFGGSEAGAILDMETDQFTLLVLALAAQAVGAGPWPVLVPEFRYLFVLAMRAARIPCHDPKPMDGDNRRGKLVCALVPGLLLAATFPPMPATGRVLCGIAATVALAGSYAGDVRFLVRRYRAASSPSR